MIAGTRLRSGLDLEPKRDSDLCLPEFERHRSEVRFNNLVNFWPVNTDKPEVLLEDENRET